MGRVSIKHDAEGAERPLTWRMEDDVIEGAKVPTMICDKGHPSTIRTHKVGGDGSVSPSSVCPIDGCDFHDFVTLDGWQEHGAHLMGTPSQESPEI